MAIAKPPVQNFDPDVEIGAKIVVFAALMTVLLRMQTKPT